MTETGHLVELGGAVAAEEAPLIMAAGLLGGVIDAHVEGPTYRQALVIVGSEERGGN